MAALPLLLGSLALVLGVLPLGPGATGLGLGALALALAAGRCWRPGRLLPWLLVLVLCWGRGLAGRPHPGPGDPVHRLPPGAHGAAGVVVSLRGTLLEDPQPLGASGACRALLQLPAGRTELRFRPCPPLQQGWRLAADGLLQHPIPAPHPLLSGQAERLQRLGCWSVMAVERWQLRGRPATPLVDLRRRMAHTLVARGGPERGGVLAALVLGSAVVPVPQAVRESFRVAGLSHALAASGFHLTVLLGAVMVVGRRLPGPLRCGLALGAMALFLVLAGPQPSVCGGTTSPQRQVR